MAKLTFEEYMFLRNWLRCMETIKNAGAIPLLKSCVWGEPCDGLSKCEVAKNAT